MREYVGKNSYSTLSKKNSIFSLIIRDDQRMVIIGYTQLPNYHQEFQVPKMEVLNLIRLFWG